MRPSLAASRGMRGDEYERMRLIARSHASRDEAAVNETELLALRLRLRDPTLLPPSATLRASKDRSVGAEGARLTFATISVRPADAIALAAPRLRPLLFP